MNATLANENAAPYGQAMHRTSDLRFAFRFAGLAVALCVLVGPTVVTAKEGATEPSVDEIVEAVQVRRPATDFRLRARLFKLEGVDTKKDAGVIEVLMKPSATETRTVVRVLEPSKNAGLAVLVVQPVNGEPRYFVSSGAGKPAEELRGEQLKEAFVGTDFSYEDLNLAFFLYWPKRELIGTDSVRGQTCYKVEFRPLKDASTQYSKVAAWIEKKRFVITKTEAYDQAGEPLRKFSVAVVKKETSKKGNEFWTVRAMEMFWRPPQQAMPSWQKTRLEVVEDEYDAELPEKMFLPDGFPSTP